MSETKYSQNDEQAILAGLLSHVSKGHLLDIGAYVPDTFSNSRSLIDDGWSAVLVEPSPVPFTALLRHYGGNPKVQLVNVAVSPTVGGWVEFYDSDGDAISSCSIEHKAKWEAGHKVTFRAYSLCTVTVASLLARFGSAFDFINLDVEGVNLEIFRALPFWLPRLKVICVEHDGHVSEMQNLAAPFGFKAVMVNNENLILSR